jgi:hypothetical protein
MLAHYYLHFTEEISEMHRGEDTFPDVTYWQNWDIDLKISNPRSCALLPYNREHCIHKCTLQILNLYKNVSYCYCGW